MFHLHASPRHRRARAARIRLPRELTPNTLADERRGRAVGIGERSEEIPRPIWVCAELALRFAGEDSGPQLYETVVDVLDRIASSAPERTIEDGLAGWWRIVSVLGFTPELSSCALCHTPLRDTEDISECFAPD